MRNNKKGKELQIETEKIQEGVYYAIEDYAGLIKRFFIIGVDFVVICVSSLGIIVLLSKLPEDQELIFISNLPIMLFISYIYLVLIKRSDWGTLGYMLTKVKIVSLEGKKPPIWKMTLRFLLLIFGPINFFFDIFWLTGDKHKQTVRDKIVGTYVIAEDAAPLGRGKILYTSYFLFGWNFVFREVKILSPK